MFPRKDTASFKIMECLHKHGDMTVDHVIAKIGHITSQQKRSVMLSLMKHMVKRGYLMDYGDYFRLTSELKAYVEDVLEMYNPKPKENLVLPPYKNPFTPAIKKYNLFENKRGYS